MPGSQAETDNNKRIAGADAPKATSKSTYTNVRDTPEDKVRRIT
jgi:hypothetical protein